TSPVPALNANPNTPNRRPATDPPQAATTLATTRCRCHALACTAACNSENSHPTDSATRNNAAASLGKHEPPHPGPGCKNACPIRRSSPMPSVTAAISAPTNSHNSATALTYDNFTAKKQFAAYLTISALAASVSTVGAPNRAYNPATRSAASGESDPTTIRSGRRKSATAEPSRKNSGLLTTATSERPNHTRTRAAVPTGTVDFNTTTHPAGNTDPTSATTARTAATSACPSAPIGVGTHTNTTSASATAAAEPTTNDNRPAANPSATNSANPGSANRTRPRDNSATLPASTSLHTTRCPSDAKHAPVVNPT